MTAWHPDVVAGAGDILLVCDHASSVVPDDIDLGIAPDLLARHIAVDIGAGPLTHSLARALGARAVVATVSRLVIDFNRPSDHPGLIPLTSDGHAIPGNEGADRPARIARFHAPYHRAIAAELRHRRPAMIVAIHSFTPMLESGGDPRPWQVGILYNRDARAARLAIAAFERAAIITGDNQPYSGRQLNMTLNRHAEGQGIAGLSIEVRNDLIADAAGIAHWAAIIAPIIAQVRSGLA